MSGFHIALLVAFLVSWGLFRSFIVAVIITAVLWYFDANTWAIWNSDWVTYTWDTVSKWVMAGGKWLVWWYLVGLLSAAYWPWKYRKNLHSREVPWLIVTTPFYAILGPIALLARYPL